MEAELVYPSTLACARNLSLNLAYHRECRTTVDATADEKAAEVSFTLPNAELSYDSLFRSLQGHNVDVRRGVSFLAEAVPKFAHLHGVM